jgi:hypothetical protein
MLGNTMERQCTKANRKNELIPHDSLFMLMPTTIVPSV